MTTLIGNTFSNNKDGVPIYFHGEERCQTYVMFLNNIFYKLIIIAVDSNFVDGGGNEAYNNDKCNGVFVENGQQCIEFVGTSTSTSIGTNPAPTSQPSLPNFPKETGGNESDNSEVKDFEPVSTVTVAPRGGVGYFNYNTNDKRYGPKRWGNVKNNPEYKRYLELSNTLRRNLRNKCNWSNINQSPIDLCENKINKECEEFHQTRTHSGNIKLGDQEVTAQILPR